ncbi:uncharacterized protein LOC126895321 [Daktulosphaira vitifoliae]|uniref:uncharacterized protein LOC126895321 n=1 Tax=Daktulosphaira vitifoliae TaxID=58002 RepID=UPI0021AABEF0|nr:uncharacterized protein LOC126895321 [Daktulosphaira vitifoliae]
MSRKINIKISDDEEEDKLDFPSLNADEVQWDSKQKIALLNSMINLKPAGIHKHLSMLLIRENVSKSLKTNIPSEAIWNFLHSHWKMDIADEIENINIPHTIQDFSLPNDDDWTQLIEEQKMIINSNKKANNCDIIYKNSDVKILQTVKVIIEKLDDQNLPLYMSKLNALKNTLKSDYSIHNSSNVLIKNTDNTSKTKLGKSTSVAVYSKNKFNESHPSNNSSLICVKENRCSSLSKKRKLNMSVCSTSLYNDTDNLNQETKSHMVINKPFTRRHSLNLLKCPAIKLLHPVNLDIEFKEEVKNLQSINSIKVLNCERKTDCSSSKDLHPSGVSTRSKMLDFKSHSSGLFYEKLIFPETENYTNKQLPINKKAKSMTSKVQNSNNPIGKFSKTENVQQTCYNNSLTKKNTNKMFKMSLKKETEVKKKCRHNKC